MGICVHNDALVRRTERSARSHKRDHTAELSDQVDTHDSRCSLVIRTLADLDVALRAYGLHTCLTSVQSPRVELSGN